MPFLPSLPPDSIACIPLPDIPFTLTGCARDAGGNTASDLQQAAERLAEAAVTHAQGTSLALSKEAVAELKRVGANTENLGKTLSTLESKLDASINLSSELKKLAVTQTLQWAMEHSDLGSFSYMETGSHGTPTTKTSAQLTKDVLLAFNRGLGKWIPNEYSCITDDEAGRQAFMSKLSRQIHELTGQKPRCAKEMNGKVEQWAIYRE